MTILVNSVNKQMLKRIRNDKQNAVTLNLFQGLVVRYFATLSMTGNILCHSEYCRLGLDPTISVILRSERPKNLFKIISKIQ